MARKKTDAGSAQAPKKSGKKADSKPASGGKKKDEAPPPPPPVPRTKEITGCVFLLLAICVIISMFNTDGVAVATFRDFLTGLIGWGYWLAAPALLISAGVLIFHRGKPVTLRVVSLLLLPLLFGGIAHLLFCPLPEEGANISDTVGEFFAGGQQLKTGGALGGLLAMGMEMALSVYGALPVLLIVFCIFAFIGLKISPSALMGKVARKRSKQAEKKAAKREAEAKAAAATPPELDYAPPAKPAKGKAPAQVQRVARPAYQVDVPLGEEEEPLLLNDDGYIEPEPYVTEPREPKRAKVRRKPAAPPPPAQPAAEDVPDVELEGFREIPRSRRRYPTRPRRKNSAGRSWTRRRKPWKQPSPSRRTGRTTSSRRWICSNPAAAPPR